MFLSFESSDQFLKAKKTLDADLGKESKESRDAFSMLKTQIKVDLVAYDIEQVRTKIG